MCPPPHPMYFIHVEDNPMDAELVQEQILREWPQGRIERVESRATFEAVLKAGAPDLILSDFSLPSFDGLSALSVARQLSPGTPFIFLSGTIGEEVAVEALKNGAVDYVLKDRMGRLVPAIRRAIFQAEEQRKHRQAELQLQENQERIRQQASLLDKARDAICVTDLTHQVTYWNASAESLFGWPVTEAMGRDVQRLIFQHETTRHEEALRHVRSEGRWEGELRLQTKAGATVVVESRWTLVTDARGEPRSILLINTDITERKRLEVQFLRAQRMESIGTLAGGIAHDLNNVLTPILVAAQVLQTHAPKEDRVLLETIEKSALHGASLIKQVLLFARGAEGEHTPLQFRHLVTEMEKLLRDTLPRSIEIHTRFDKDLLLVRGDATQLNQVLMNLCVNARDAMPDGGTIEVRAANHVASEEFWRAHPEMKPGPLVLLSVSDTGTGIPPDVIERIWDPFFTTKELGKGTGLGLSTVVGIVKGHGGAVNVQSQPGQGTRFEVYLPAVAQEAKTTPPVSRAPLPRGNGEGILIVDDEVYIRDVIGTMLRYCGYRGFFAAGGLDSLDVYQKHQHEIALVLVDMMMPGLDGGSTMRLLRDLNPDVRLVAMSGMLENASLGSGSELDNVELLRKPITAEALLTTIARALNGSAASSAG